MHQPITEHTHVVDATERRQAEFSNADLAGMMGIRQQLQREGERTGLPALALQIAERDIDAIQGHSDTRAKQQRQGEDQTDTKCQIDCHRQALYLQ